MGRADSRDQFGGFLASSRDRGQQIMGFSGLVAFSIVFAGTNRIPWITRSVVLNRIKFSFTLMKGRLKSLSIVIRALGGKPQNVFVRETIATV
jgi:hypothetical protein